MTSLMVGGFDLLQGHFNTLLDRKPTSNTYVDYVSKLGSSSGGPSAGAPPPYPCIWLPNLHLGALDAWVTMGVFF